MSVWHEAELELMIEQLRADLELRNQTALDRKDIIAKLDAEIERLTRERDELRTTLKEAAGYIRSSYSDEGTWFDVGAMKLVKLVDALKQKVVVLSEHDHAALMTAIEAPPEPNEKLKSLLRDRKS